MAPRRLLIDFGLWLLILLGALTQAQAANNAGGETVLDNDRVVVQRYVVPPGGARGPQGGTGNQLWVQMNDGEWKSPTDPAKTSRSSAGAVGWAEGQAGESGMINGGSSPIEMLWLTLKPHSASAADIAAMKNYRLIYPQIPGQVLLENDQVVVQRFVVKPGTCEGVHAHPGNQAFIHVKGGAWAVRRAGKEEVSEAPTGSVGWYPLIPLSDQHQSGNVGHEPIDLVWVTLKK